MADEIFAVVVPFAITESESDAFEFEGKEQSGLRRLSEKIMSKRLMEVKRQAELNNAFVSNLDTKLPRRAEALVHEIASSCLHGGYQACGLKTATQSRPNFVITLLKPYTQAFSLFEHLAAPTPPAAPEATKLGLTRRGSFQASVTDLPQGALILASLNRDSLLI